MSNVTEMTYDDWAATFRPVKNHLKRDAPFDGCMFETHGQELAEVRYAHPFCIWTIVTGDDGMSMSNGFSIVNRMGYLITEIPYEGENFVVVNLEDD